jgi:membrane protein
MEPINTPFSITPIHLPSGYSIFKRLANLVLVVATVVVCINLWLISSEHSTNWQNKQANQLGNSLTSFAAKVLTSTLLVNDPSLLTEQLSYLASDPHVESVTLYDEKGRLLAENNTSTSVVATFKLKPFNPLVFVRKITHQQQTIGYLSLILNEQAVMAFHSEYQHQLNQQLQMLMVLAAIFGIVMTRAFYKLRYRQIIRTSKS